MISEQTHSLLKSLRLMGMADAYELQQSNSSTSSLGFDERLALLVDAEQGRRDQKREQRLIRSAKLKTNAACLEDVKYSGKRSLDKSLINSLSPCEWITRHQHLVITGPTGVGKTWLGCAFAMQAIRKGMPVMYRRVGRLMEEIEIARADGSLPRLRTQIIKAQLLILDDWAIAPLKARARQDFLELIDDRTGSGSVLMTSQLPVAQWHDYIGDPTLADAILDRILHRSHFIEIQGESMRRLEKVKKGDA